MKRKARIIIYSGSAVAATIVLALGVFAYGRLSGNIQFHHVPTPGCAPAVPRGAYIIASAWKEPGPFDLVCYRQERTGGKEVWVQRICGMPGDTVEMRAGVLHVNGIDADRGLRLQHRYHINQRQERQLLKRGVIAPDDVEPLSSYAMVAHVPDDAASEQLLSRAPYPWNWKHPTAFHQTDWGEDELPPVVVPADSWFMLGDNRHMSVDSRYIGFVPRSSFAGTVLKVFH